LAASLKVMHTTVPDTPPFDYRRPCHLERSSGSAFLTGRSRKISLMQPTNLNNEVSLFLLIPSTRRSLRQPADRPVEITD